MKITSTIFLLVFSFLVIQPLFGTRVKEEKKECCQKRCPNEKKQSKKNDCQPNGCNPFMPCIYGNFYLLEKSYVVFTGIENKKAKLFFYNDNRLCSNLSDCWHPPEYFSSIS